jgi:hypothetical protein
VFVSTAVLTKFTPHPPNPQQAVKRPHTPGKVARHPSTYPLTMARCSFNGVLAVFALLVISATLGAEAAGCDAGPAKVRLQWAYSLSAAGKANPALVTAAVNAWLADCPGVVAQHSGPVLSTAPATFG